MNSRDSHKSPDELGALIRHSLRRTVANRLPAPGVRRRILQRAAERQRRPLPSLTAALPWFEWFGRGRAGSELPAAWDHPRYLDSLVSLHLNWFAFSQLTR